ncbi:MAG: DNA translocase FtsK 4TM domain-containing protein [Elusimicrobia bacterium]|nr:DNA translocase FtsK 4TM domain-containing protein [Elusimicrobiota bacterium]
MPILYASSAKKKRKGALWAAALWTLAAAAGLFLACVVYLPSPPGWIGQALRGRLLSAFGGAAYLLPLLAVYGMLARFRSGGPGRWTLAAGSALLLFSAAFLLENLGALFKTDAWGGGLGFRIAAVARTPFGQSGSFILSMAACLLGLQVLFGVSWAKLIVSTVKLAVEDYRGWVRSRRELRDMVQQAALRPKAPKTAGIAEVPIQARETVVEPKPEPAAQKTPAGPSEGDGSAAPKPKRKGADPAHTTAPRAALWRLPSLELLSPRRPGAPSGRPSEEEIREAVEKLDKTLASFQIDARVGGISPGPVITQYEVVPAPGVTVNSITARADDIALAMKARGIRMIAPIPGKSAIGIEIPNRSCATVTLREVLESPAIAANPAPLAFALGLSSDGTPLAADLGAMPHILVAGATNSGKSVFVHALITSILFRRRPDEVKFLLIDPKRIELSQYDGIPHLYDPKTSCKDVSVVTSAKDASKSLKALVRVMERRYEKFQQYRARDIAAFNEEAARRGEPEEFRILVVIDELADLMVVAKDVVEDSVQRLTQMARAVGIHIVLATQRPSVDVITGVIKANLPSRVAMRVASEVDSKVILDTCGAKSLLGRGDMLYLSPGQDLQRIQGCFISSQETADVVLDLRGKGAPDYPTPETAGSIGEADLSKFNVEPLEFLQALKLVLERRRVSQDLLKSQFGSSARATNLLSLLEIKGFIFKPEGSNRWEIYFDKIEDYLRTNGGPASGGQSPDTGGTP